MRKGDLVFGVEDFGRDRGRTVWVGLVLRGPEKRQDVWMVQIYWERVSEKSGILRGHGYTAYEYATPDIGRRFVEDCPDLVWDGIKPK